MATSGLVNLFDIEPMADWSLSSRYCWYGRCIARLSGAAEEDVGAALERLVQEHADTVFAKLDPIVTTRSGNIRYGLNRDYLREIMCPVLVHSIGCALFGDVIPPSQWEFPPIRLNDLLCRIKLGFKQGIDQLPARLELLVRKHGTDVAIKVLCSELRSEAKCPD